MKANRLIAVGSNIEPEGIVIVSVLIAEVEVVVIRLSVVRIA